MRKAIIFLGVWVNAWLAAGQIDENFNDGDFTSNPAWLGQTTRFVINASNELQLNAPTVAEESYLVTSLGQLENQTWNFLVKMGFATSSTSLTKVYLLSSAQDLTGALNGYYVLIGETLDEVSLYRQDGLISSILINGADGSVASSTVAVRIRVSRDSNGDWELLRDVTGGTSYLSEGTANDNTYQMAGYFGFRCKYTSSRSTLFYFDDITIDGTPFVDSSGPNISSATATTATSVDVLFNEPLDETTAENVANYALNGSATVASATLDGSNPALVHLTTSTLTNGQTYTLTVNNVEDVNGNAIAPNSTVGFTYLVLSVAGFREVVINEFMVDPAPPVGLPETDFVELYNPTDKYFDLTGWRVGDNAGQSGTIGSFILAPDSYLIVCPTTFVTQFEAFGSTRGVSTFPNFNSTTPDAVVLYNAGGAEIDRVNYTSGLPIDGITFEQVDPTLICSGTFNFRPSEGVLGGTPGTENSVFQIVPDNFGPNVSLVRAISADSIRIDFDETINGALVPSALFQISPAVDVEAASYLSEYPASVFLRLAADVAANTSYTVTVSGISDCSGNPIEGTQGTFVLGATPQAGDVLLSEVLFNPRTGGSDFVELFNPSATTHFELRGWKLARLVNGAIDSPNPIAADGLLLAPRSFLVFTVNAANISLEYPMGNADTYVQLSSLPSYNDSDGIVLLLNAQDEIMQQFEYTDDFHYDLLESEDGVSLERISYTAEVNDKNNWRSAASTVGFATPGRPNSQSAEIAAASGKLSVDPKVFLPGNAGTGRDFTTINYQFNSPGQFANIMIYDQQGRPVKQLANGASLATEGFFRWDGTTDRGGMARMGYYLIVFELYSGTGKTQTLKETVVVGRDF